MKQRAQDHGDEALRIALDALRNEVRALRKEMAGANRQLLRTEHHVNQLIALRQDEEQGDERLDRLASVLDPRAAERHADEAIAAARRIETPVPHLIIEGLLSPPLYEAIRDAVPALVFFTPRQDGASEMRVPPELAPVDVIATWKFIAALAKHTIVPVTLKRFADVLGEEAIRTRAVEGRLIRLEGADASAAAETVAFVEPPEIRLKMTIQASDGERYSYEITTRPRI